LERFCDCELEVALEATTGWRFEAGWVSRRPGLVGFSLH
jgi:hypothetical protein